ncbi:hypothetical protein AVEN_71523-1 [Araneus ventricosus]|uniref:PiggyBac transposable element-derived protein domain-containing protein n=1 Tax=Araneus ventricosus TaxID=182803 RepID=A0A4Y2QCA4_ARAVE|nr:hypothetical protein AVEN_71523-1 [Araneus ventricosus]
MWNFAVKYLHKEIVNTKIKRGETVAQRKHRIVVMKWKDKRNVLMIATEHSGKMMLSNKKNRKGESIIKPDCILDYDKYMCNIDKIVQLLSYYSPLQKSLKWYRKVVLQHLDIVVSNSLHSKVGGKQF